MIERRKRGMVRTGTAALGAALMAIALAASPVGATPFTGQSSGSFYTNVRVDENSVPLFTLTHALTSGHSSLIGAVQCKSVSVFSINRKTPRHCAATESEFRAYTDGPGYAECSSEDKGGIVFAGVVASESYSCVPPECFAPDGTLVAGCTATTQVTYEINGGTGIYRNSAGSFTTTTTATYDTPWTGSLESDTAGDMTLAGGAPPDDVFLDIPGSGSTQSGVGVVAGWSCLGGHLEVEFSEADGTPILTDPLPYGAYRPFTQDVCGDTDNGFSMPMNWGRLGPGEKTLTLFVNGEERVTQNFFVTTFGEAFVTDAGGTCEIADLRDGQNATFVWQQANQGLVLEESLQ